MYSRQAFHILVHLLVNVQYTYIKKSLKRVMIFNFLSFIAHEGIIIYLLHGTATSYIHRQTLRNADSNWDKVKNE